MRSIGSRSTIALVAFAALPALAACSSNSSSTGGASGSASATGSASVIKVAATDTACQLSATTAKAGATTFAITNNGSQITEVYIYGKDGDSYSKVVSELENIGPGINREMTADLTAGSYEVACKPGQTGSGIRTPLTVS